ncbi:hypothetical protein Tco_0619754 [Tanacetum coccineum]
MVVQAQEEIGEGSAMPTDPHYTPITNQPSSSQPQRKEKSRSLKLRVKKLEKKGGSRTHKLRRLYKVGRSTRVVLSDEASLGDHEDVSKQGRKIDDIDADAGITLDITHFDADTDMLGVHDLDGDEVVVESKVAAKKKDDEVNVVEEVVNAAEETVNAAIITEDEITLAQAMVELKSVKPKMKKKDQISFDEQEAIRLQAEFNEEVRLAREKDEANVALIEEWNDIQAKIDKRRKHFAAKRAEEKRNIPPTKAQQRSIMCTYLENMTGWKPKDLKNKSFANIQELFDKAMKRVNIFVDMDTELVEGSEIYQKQKIDDVKETPEVDEDKEIAELQSLMKVIPDEEEVRRHLMKDIPNEEKVAVDAIPLATKPPSIVDWKILKEGKISYYQIIRADGTKHGYTRPEDGYERVLWGDLKTMFEHHVEDTVWRNLQGNKVLVWKLFDSCRVHFVRFQSLHVFMLVEKRYPLTLATITEMLNKKLQADHWNEICYQLLKLITKQLKNQ